MQFFRYLFLQQTVQGVYGNYTDTIYQKIQIVKIKKGNIKPKFGMILPFYLICLRLGHACGGEHVFNKNPVTARRVADHDVRDRADELAVLNDGTARQECGQ